MPPKKTAMNKRVALDDVDSAALDINIDTPSPPKKKRSDVNPISDSDYPSSDTQSSPSSPPPSSPITDNNVPNSTEEPNENDEMRSRTPVRPPMNNIGKTGPTHPTQLPLHDAQNRATDRDHIGETGPTHPAQLPLDNAQDRATDGDGPDVHRRSSDVPDVPVDEGDLEVMQLTNLPTTLLTRINIARHGDNGISRERENLSWGSTDGNCHFLCENGKQALFWLVGFVEIPAFFAGGKPRVPAARLAIKPVTKVDGDHAFRLLARFARPESQSNNTEGIVWASRLTTMDDDGNPIEFSDLYNAEIRYNPQRALMQSMSPRKLRQGDIVLAEMSLQRYVPAKGTANKSTRPWRANQWVTWRTSFELQAVSVLWTVPRQGKEAVASNSQAF